MPPTRTILRVFASSPGDISEEKAALGVAIKEYNDTWSHESGIQLELVRWETHAFPGVGEDAQAVINEELPQDYELFVGIMWTRFGTPTGRAGSGTEEEFNRALSRFRDNPEQIRIMFYFKNAPVSPSDIDLEQLGKIKEFQSRLGEEGTLYWEFQTTDEFERLVRVHLSRQIQGYGKSWGERVGNVQDQQIPVSQLPSIHDSPTVGQDASEDDEPGFLDILAESEDSGERFNESLERIGEATQNVGQRMAERTEEIEGLSVSGQPARAKQLKNVTNRAASDMNTYATLMETELPIVTSAFSGIIDPLTKAVSIARASGGSSRQEAQSLQDTIRKLMATIAVSSGQGQSFRDVIASLPRATTSLNHAKRRVVSALDSLQSEMSSWMNLLREVDKALDDLVCDTSGGNGGSDIVN